MEHWTYDKVGNITISSGERTGSLSHRYGYGYDALDRLVSATQFYGLHSNSATDTLSMSYDDLWRVTGKSQRLSQSFIVQPGTLHAGYDMTYNYDPAWGRHYQMKDVSETHYRTEGAPMAADSILSIHSYSYDPNGNLAHESVARKRLNGDTTRNISERKLLWDGMNRLKAISENGYVSLYWYDADGNRTVKEHGGGEATWVNSSDAGTTTDTVTYSIYPNPYININGNRWTKHYYIGGERFASSTGTLSDFNDLNDSNNAAAGHGIADVNYDSMCQAEEDSINSIYSHFDVPYEARHINTRDNGWHLYLPATHEDEGNDGNETAEILEKEQLRNDPTALVNGQMYFYQRDHLGSTMLVTDSIGNTVQLVEYTPWGEVFVERRFGTSGFDTPYLFNGKELDEETGLYYYGARYYDPKMSVWYSTDPMEEKYPYLTSYGYVYNNPIKLIDPNGKTPWGAIVEGVGAFFVNAGIDFFTKWIFEGQNIKTAYNNINWGAATFDGLSTAALSFFVDGTGSAKNLNKIASSKPGRFALDVSQIMATNIISKIEMGASLRDIRWRDELLYASFSKCISLGMESKANELLELLKESNSKMYNAAKKLQRNIEAGKNDARINSDRNQVKITSTNALKNSLSYGKETTKNRAVSGSLTGVIRHDNESIRHDD